MREPERQDVRTLNHEGNGTQVRIRSAVFTALSITTAAVVAAIAPASAQAATASTTGTAAATQTTHAAFAAQAHGAGLSSSQASALQAKVDGYLAKTGGTQVAANKIDLGGKGVLVLTVPGESHARDLSASATPQQTYYCQVGHFCAYSAPNLNGNVFDWYYCGTYDMPWAATGSFDDQQYPFTETTFHEGRWGDHSFSAVLTNPSFDWTPVLSITVC